MKTKKSIIRLCLTALSWGVFLLAYIPVMAQVSHYTVSDGLQTNEVRQIMELPNGQIMVNCEGAFCLFDGQVFREIPCDYSRAYRLKRFGGYAHLWQGDSLLLLRDFHHLYLFDTRTRSFRYDVKARLAETPVKQLIAREGSEENTEERWQQLADSIGAMALVAQAMTDRQGGRWIGTRGNGLFYIRPPHPQAIFMGHNDSLLYAARYLHDSHGQIWKCTQNGLYCFPKSNIQFSDSKATHYGQDNVSDFVHNWMTFISELPDGRFLLCIKGNQLGYFDPERRTFEC